MEVALLSDFPILVRYCSVRRCVYTRSSKLSLRETGRFLLSLLHPAHRRLDDRFLKQPALWIRARNVLLVDTLMRKLCIDLPICLPILLIVYFDKTTPLIAFSRINNKSSAELTV